MIEYFYTLDIGQTYGPVLEELAALAGFDDVEEFAALILCHALEGVKNDMETEDLEVGDTPFSKEDDDIPF